MKELTGYMKLLVLEKKRSKQGVYFNCRQILNDNRFRMYKVFQLDFKRIKFSIGSLLTVSNVEILNGSLTSFIINNEIKGNVLKESVEICIDDFKVGDLVDGVPILSIPTLYWYKNNKRISTANFYY